MGYLVKIQTLLVSKNHGIYRTRDYCKAKMMIVSNGRDLYDSVCVIPVRFVFVCEAFVFFMCILCMIMMGM